MSAETFLKDYKAYFVDQELSEYDEQRIKLMFQQHSAKKPAAHMESCTVKYIIKNVPKSTKHIKYVYVDTQSGVKYRKMTDVPSYQEFIDKAIKDACDLWSVSVNDVMKRSKERHLVNCRMFIVMKLTDYGLGCVEIAKLLKSYKDHSGIVHLVKNGRNLLDANTEPFTTLWKAYNKDENIIVQEKGMPEVWQEEAGNGVLHSEGETEGGHSGVPLQPLHGVQA